MRKLFNSYVLIVLFSMILVLNITYFKIYGITDPSLKVKIVYPYKNSNFTINDNLQVKGSSNYNPVLNCTVSLIINDKKPYTVVIPKGTNGTKDFTKWEFDVDKKDTLFNGTNKITAKNHCISSNSSVFNSVFFNISSASNIVSNQTSNLNGTNANNTATNDLISKAGAQPSASNIVSNQTSNLNGTNANNTATNDLISKAGAQPSASNIVSNSDNLIISKNFIPNLTAASNTICCQSLVSEEQKLPKVSDGLFKKVSADDSSQNQTASASESPSQGKKAEQSASENGEQKQPTASDGLFKKVSADDSSQNQTASASESPSQGKNVTQNLSQEVQLGIDRLSSDNGDDELDHDSHKKDDNQDSDTSSKTDLDDLHKLKSFLHKELK